MAGGRTAILRVRILSDGDGRGFLQTERNIDRVSRSANSLAGKLAKVAAVGPAVAAGVAVAGAAVGSLVVGLAGVGALAAPALGAVALGWDGIKTAAGGAAPALERAKSAVSSVFAADLAAPFRQLGGVLDGLTPSLQSAARGVSSMVTDIVGVIGNMQPQLRTLTEGSAQFFRALGPPISAAVGDLINFGAQAASQASSVGASFGGLIRSITGALAGLPVAQLMSTFATTLDGLGALLGPIITLFGQLAIAAGPSIGQAFAALGAVVTALTPPLMEIASIAGPALVQIITALTPGIAALANGFADVLTVLAPLAVGAASLASSLVSGLGPALGPILLTMLGLAVALKAVTAAIAIYKTVTTAISAATKAWAVVQNILNISLLANPIVLIVLAVIALIAVIVLVATKTQFFQTIWAAMCSFVTAAWNAVVGFVVAAWQAIVAAVSAAIGFITGLVSTVVGFIVGAWNSVLGAASAVWGAITGVVSGAMGVVQGAIAGAINVAIGVFNTFRAVGSAVFGAVAGAAGAISGAVQTVIGWVQQLISWLSQISFPSPPSWVTSLFDAEALGPTITTGAAGAVMAAFTPSASMSAGMRGGSRSGGGDTYIDQSTHVTVDGSGAIDPQAIASAVTGAVGRNAKTRGLAYAVKL